jgi:diguanylate cyclase (GGDEF)-like protein
MTEFSAYRSLLRALRRWSCEPSGVVLCVDIRGLRAINRIGGPAAGDEVIRKVLGRLRLWAGPLGVHGRLWGDEFIAARAIDHPQSAPEEAALLRDALAALRYQSPLGDSRVSVAIGMCVVRPGADWEQVLVDAGEACRAAKRRGHNQVVTHVAAKNPAGGVRHDADLIGHFRALLAEGRLLTYLQPIMDISGSRPRLAKAEFLLRVDLDGRVQPLPAGTIEALERCGLGTELDGYVSQHVIDWLVEHPLVLERLDNVSINLSAQSLMDAHFVDGLLREVRRRGVSARQLCFEITETAAVENLELAAEVIGMFHEVGCKWSLDDFGSGLCSFGYLHTLPVDEIKIDGRFTRELSDNPATCEIVRAINHVAHATGKKTVAEFVDRPERLQVLRSIGVDYAQGWLFYPALPPERFLELLAVSHRQAARRTGARTGDAVPGAH